MDRRLFTRAGPPAHREHCHGPSPSHFDRRWSSCRSCVVSDGRAQVFRVVRAREPRIRRQLQLQRLDARGLERRKEPLLRLQPADWSRGPDIWVSQWDARQGRGELRQTSATSSTASSSTPHPRCLATSTGCSSTATARRERRIRPLGLLSRAHPRRSRLAAAVNVGSGVNSAFDETDGRLLRERGRRTATALLRQQSARRDPVWIRLLRQRLSSPTARSVRER